MTNVSLNFGGNISQNYEDLLGPFIFEPFALELAKMLRLPMTGKVLELACGTGRLTQHIAKRLPEAATFIASDLNRDMISVAQSKVDLANIEWATVDMLDIPYPSNTFNLVVCQFGIMLVPDHDKALSEIFRILKPGGKLVFSTWASIEDNPLWAITDEVLNRFLDKQPLLQIPGPFSMSNETEVMLQLQSTGFSDVMVTPVFTTAQTLSAKVGAEGFIKGLPVISFIAAHNPQSLPDIIYTLSMELSGRLGDQPLQAAQKAWMFEMIKK